MKVALIVYWSKTGNTEKVALAIKDGLTEGGFKVDMKRPDDEGVVDFARAILGTLKRSWVIKALRAQKSIFTLKSNSTRMEPMTNSQ